MPCLIVDCRSIVFHALLGPTEQEDFQNIECNLSSKGSDRPAPPHGMIRAFAVRMHVA